MQIDRTGSRENQTGQAPSSRRRGFLSKSLFMAVQAAMLASLVMVAPALAGPSPTGATIASDKADYAPGETVTLTGTGWASGEAVRIVVNDTYGASWQRDVTVTATTEGGITDAFALPNYFVSDYDVTASGPVSGSATTTFTDLSIGTYDQCSNDDGDGYATGDTGCRWINGNLQANNSTYAEGDATVQRVWLTDFLPGRPTPSPCSTEPRRPGPTPTTT